MSSFAQVQLNVLVQPCFYSTQETEHMHFNDHNVLCCSFFLWWMTIPFYQLGSEKFYGVECRFSVQIKLFMGMFWSESRQLVV